MQVGLLLALLLLSPAHAAAQPLQPEDVFALQWVSDPQISPDGRRIAYVRNSMDINEDRRCTSLWLIGSDGKGDRVLVAEDVAADTVRWSPDSERLLYVLSPGRVHIMQVATGRSHAVAVFPGKILSPAWSPDGRSIALVTRVPRDSPPLFQMPAKPSGANWAAPARVIMDFPYRRDGVGTLVAGTDQVFVVDASGGAPRQLTRGIEDVGEPAWTSDSKSLLVTADRRAQRDRTESDREIYRLSVAEPDTLKALTARVGPDRAPAVSPAGERFAWLGYDDNGDAHIPGELYTANLDGSGKRSLTGSLDREVTAARWDGSGKGLFFLYGEEGVIKLAHVSLRGQIQPLAAGVGPGIIGHPSMPPGSLSVARTGLVAFTLSSVHVPGDLAVHDGRRVRRLTNLNGKLFARRELGRVEAIRFVSAIDGMPVEAWIVKPPGFDPARRYPLALSIHGGPWSAYGPYFSADHQLFAAAGYVVVYVNPRGSTSYGRGFANQTSHDFPSRDVDDLLSAVDTVVTRGYVDERNLFVMGASGGGTLAAWIVAHTDRFRAAVSSKPVIDWQSFALTTDQHFLYRRIFGEVLPWQAPLVYLEKSPIAHVAKINTPTLIVVGETDLRTPLAQSEELYHALRFRGVDAALVQMPGAFHDISLRPSQMIAWAQAGIGWFERYRRPDHHRRANESTAKEESR